LGSDPRAFSGLGDGRPPAIRQVGDPILRTVAEPVTDFGPWLGRLVAQMHTVMNTAAGVGLAANQIGVGLAVFVYQVGPYQGLVVNPTDLQLSGPTVVELEGCLSVAGLAYPTARAEQASVSGQDLAGEPISVHGQGLLARCLQHEVDHLRGGLYLDRLTGDARSEARQWLAQATTR